MTTAETGAAPPPRAGWFALAAATLLTGVLAGLAGLLLGLLLHGVQHLAYGYGLTAGAPHQSFLEGVTAAPPARRVLALTLAGLLAGGGWAALYRWGRPLVPIATAAGPGAVRMPWPETVVHALLQIVTVALGSPLGREVAPREIGALLSSALARGLRLTAADARLLTASGAGAGLAAVYNVPFAAAIFVLETLLGTFAPRAAAVALGSCAVAAVIARTGLGEGPVYTFPPLPVAPLLLLWALAAGPLFGWAGYWFSRAAAAARAHAARGRLLPVACLVFFPVLGLLAIPFPQLLGNGKGILQLELDGAVEPSLAAVLLGLRFLLPLGALAAGAAGGLLTPGSALGALLATLAGAATNRFWPGIAPAEFALVGATAFLAASSRMPLTAIALLLEFTHAPAEYLAPLLLATAGATAVREACARNNTSAR